MIGVFGRGAVMALLVLSCLPFSVGVARADGSYNAGPTPILRVNLDSGNVLIQTSDSPEISVQSPQGGINVHQLAADDPNARLPGQINIPQLNGQGPQGGTVTLPRETFVLPQIQGAHDVVVVRGAGDATITVPRGTAMVIARVRDGRVVLANYNGVFVAHSRIGGVFLEHVTGTGFAQSLNGPVDAADSSFARLRARTGTGDMFFRNCTSNQIEASSTYGSIVYDNGQFEPGLARFESQYGNVAIGVQNGGSGVQIGAHSGDGHIVSNFGDGTQVSGNETNTQATVRGGGPVVTTSSENGSVYLYNGSMSAHPAVQQELEAGSSSAAAAARSSMGGQRMQAAPAYQRAPQPQYPVRTQPYPVRTQPQYPVRTQPQNPRPQTYPHAPPDRSQPRQERRYNQQSPPPQRKKQPPF